MSDLRIAFRGRLDGFVLDAAFTVPTQGVTALFGPSGCGKTTVLRCIAGLARLEEGVCEIGGEVWQNGCVFQPAHRRRVGYVFQEASLFAHLSVRRNLLYGAPKSTGAGMIGFDEVTTLLGIGALLDRAPHHLSGGERQRVAIGRALLSQPSVLLMDEPLSALDGESKDEILPYLQRLHAALALPMIYVSHDMAEVEQLADHLVLMAAGRVVAAGPIAVLQTDPDLNLVRSKRASVSLEGVVVSYDPAYGLACLRVEDAMFLVPSAELGKGSRQRLHIRASDVSLAREPPGVSTISNVVPVRILTAIASGPHEITAVLALGLHDAGLRDAGARILARVTRRSWDILGLAEGMDVHAQIKSMALISRHNADLE